MSEKKENFLDSSSLAAIVFLALLWFGWDYYMRQKYPPPEPKTGPSLLSEKEPEKPAPPAVSFRAPLPAQEQALSFKGENMEILFSSKGLGIKRLKLKGYKSRKNRPIIFESGEKPYFSSYFLKSSSAFVPFKIKQEKSNVFTGVFSSSEGLIKKRIEVDDKNFVLKAQLEISPKKEGGFKGLSLAFSHPRPEEKPGGFFSFLLFYGQEMFKGFVSYEGGESELWTDQDITEPKQYFQTASAGLGGKYFGKAFINRAALLPSAFFEKSRNEISVRLDYEFLHSKPQSLEHDLFLGPKSLTNLQSLDGGLGGWLDFGFFGWLARPLLLFLKLLYSWCGNWGGAIILLTLLVRAGLLPINIKSYKSMKLMQKIQPQIKELKETYKSDPRKMNEEVMSLMKKHKANPLGGCLPLFIQFPVFFALYRVLGESIELYQAPFMFWIKDLSLKDPFYLLPILGGLVLFIQQAITPMSLPKEQARLMKAIPLLFSVFMLSLPSGLTLYIFVSGLFGLIQQFFFVKLGAGPDKGGGDVKVV